MSQEPRPPVGPSCERCKTDAFIRGALWRCRRCQKALRQVSTDEQRQEEDYQRAKKLPRPGVKIPVMVVRTDGVDDEFRDKVFEVGRFVRIVFKDSHLIGYLANGTSVELGYSHRGYWVGGDLTSKANNSAECHDFEITLED